MNIYNYIYRFKNVVSLSLAYTKSLFYYLLSFSFFKKSKLKNIKKILIIKSGGLGDTIICYDFIKSIKKHFTNAKIYIYCNPEHFIYLKDLNIEILTDIKSIISVNIIFDLSAKNNSVIYKTIKHDYLFFKSPIIVSDFVSFKAKKHFRPLFNKHITKYYSQILKELDIKEINTTRKTKSQNYVVFNIVAAKKIRYLPKNLVLKIISGLEKENCEIIFPYYGYVEKEYILNTIKSSSYKKIKFFDSKKKDISILIKNAKQIITSDTGIAHIAGYYQKNNVVIFGPGSKTIWKPIGKNTKVISYSGCQGCQRHRDTWKCNRECLEKIDDKELI